MPEKPGDKTDDKTDDKDKTPEVDDKTYGTFKAMMNKFISEKEDEDKTGPNRTKAAEEKPQFNFLASLFGGE